MNILVYGAGVIGSIFAGKLALAGNNVSVLARGKRLEEIKNYGIILVNPKTQKNEKASVKVIDSLLPDDEYDRFSVCWRRAQRWKGILLCW